jgi:serine protease Do
MPAAPKVTADSQKTARALSQAYNAVAEFVRPSVVQISVQKKAPKGLNGRGLPFGAPRGGNGGNMNPKDLEEMLKKFFGPEFSPEKQQFGGPRNGGIGSGFVYDDRGHIVTNNHVVENSEKIRVTFHDGTEADATVVGTDDKSDVAVIKVDNTSYPALKVGDSSATKVGDLVMAIGSPFELSQSVTTGIISATERNNLGINGPMAFESFLQTDAAINPGNSGGPLVNMDGEVIGVNSAIVTGGRGNDGIGFTIPIKMAASVADMIIKDGKVHRARIGIVLQPLTPVLAKQLGIDANTKGVLAGEILPGSPAEKAGLKQGDVIVAFNGEKVHSAPSFRLTVSASEVGKSFELTYIRDGKEQKTSIVPADFDAVNFPTEKADVEKPQEKKSEPAKTAINDFGLEVQPLTPELAKQLALDPSLQGLLVSSVKEGSPAEDKGIAEGDVITKVIKDKRPQPVSSVKEFQELAASQDDIAFYVQGKKAGGFITLSKHKK